MYYIHNLRSQIQEWRDRVYKSNNYTIKTEFGFFWGNMNKQPILKAIIGDAINKFPMTDEQRALKFKEMRDTTRWFHFDDQLERVAFLYHMQTQALAENVQIASLVFDVYHSKDFDTSRDKFVEMVIQPILDFINDQLDEGNLVLYLLEKYRRRTEWFLYTDLMERYKNYVGKKEDVFDDDLRLYLFDQGIDYPFSRPNTPTGSADIVGMIDTNNPLILEVKYYDGDGHNRSNIISGFTQIVRYTDQYNKNLGYLVVFNVSQKEIVIDSDDNTKQFPPRISLNNRDYYIVVVNVNFDKTASTLGKLEVERFTKSEFVKEVESGRL